MERLQLEHALRAAQEITGEKEFVVIGACSILGTYPKKGEVLTRTTDEVDLYPRYHPELSNLLNAIGRYSTFSETYGFWVDPVGPETAILPTGWEKRLVKVSNENTAFAVGWCLEVHDVAVAKLIAGREKDIEFIKNLLDYGLADLKTIRKRLDEVAKLDPQIRELRGKYLDHAIGKGFSPSTENT